jgi:hypothetical protein
LTSAFTRLAIRRVRDFDLQSVHHVVQDAFLVCVAMPLDIIGLTQIWTLPAHKLERVPELLGRCARTRLNVRESGQLITGCLPCGFRKL